MSRSATAIIATFLLSAAPGPVAAADTPDATDQLPSIPGLTPSLVYTGAGFANLGGGVRAGGTYTGNLSLSLAFDGGPLYGWSDTLLYADALWIHGGQPSNFIGDAQDTFPQWNCELILALDVYEHAYFLDFQTARAKYIDAWLSVIDWSAVDARLAKGK